MSELWIVCGIVFAGVALAVHALYRMVARAQRDRKRDYFADLTQIRGGTSRFVRPEDDDRQKA